MGLIMSVALPFFLACLAAFLALVCLDAGSVSDGTGGGKGRHEGC